MRLRGATVDGGEELSREVIVTLMRPAMYGAYHHITVLGKGHAPCDRVYDVVGSLCENNDKFAIDRRLPRIDRGDILYIHDAGAQMICRTETPKDWSVQA